MAMGQSVDINEILTGVEPLAGIITNQWTNWSTLRNEWVAEKKELRNYLFATDTKKTTNDQLPWKNSTTIPKICQIRDNLHSNYLSALFPNDEWLTWASENQDSSKKEKRDTIEGYMRNKTRVSHFRNIMSQLLLDWIDYGNVFATTEYVDETSVDEGGNPIPGYVGPRPVRISPLDITFNPVAVSFQKAPKIIRSLMSVGDLRVHMNTHPGDGWVEDVFPILNENREKVKGIAPEDQAKNDAYTVDGFGSIFQYYESGYVELLEFYGTMYDAEKDELMEDFIITVVDRAHIIRKVKNPAWRGDGFRHVGWRQRPDNIYSMGPLDNLVGMQYRMDHLENLKADVFDFIAGPMLKIKGVVEDFDYEPFGRVYVGDDGDVDMMRPDATALNADTQIERLEAKMEELAGAPKQAMGIRTPGEKTAFEVQTLDNAAGRIFQNKINHFETQFLEPLLNDMLEHSRRSLSEKDVVKVIDDKRGIEIFEDITKDDLVGVGSIYPVGARHFAAQATLVQNLTTLSNSAIGQDPAVSVHISGFKLAELIEEVLNLEKYDLVRENIRVEENHKTQSLINNLQNNLNQETSELGLDQGAPIDEIPANVGIPLEGQGGV